MCLAASSSASSAVSDPGNDYTDLCDRYIEFKDIEINIREKITTTIKSWMMLKTRYVFVRIKLVYSDNSSSNNSSSNNNINQIFETEVLKTIPYKEKDSWPIPNHPCLKFPYNHDHRDKTMVSIEIYRVDTSNKITGNKLKGRVMENISIGSLESRSKPLEFSVDRVDSDVQVQSQSKGQDKGKGNNQDSIGKIKFNVEFQTKDRIP
jgi:hypothetical protein